MNQMRVHETHAQSLGIIPEGLALTGRVKSWLKNPYSRLPVSCTVFDVQDSMEGKDGIEDSWIYTSHGLRNGAGVAINLNLRPSGTENGKGLTASGIPSFTKPYNTLNEVLRRGGVYKNGAITIYCRYDHPDCPAFLALNPKEYPWIKRAVYIDGDVLTHPILDQLAAAVDKGFVWLAKEQWDSQGRRLFSNVCLEILIRSRGTCLISNINPSVLEPEEIPQAFQKGMRYLCELHKHTGVETTNYYPPGSQESTTFYLPQDQDKQVGLGILGLANFLAQQKIKYADFVDALEYLENQTDGFKLDLNNLKEFEEWLKNKSHAIYCASRFLIGFRQAAEVAREYGMERAFTVPPTATSFSKHFDKEGYSVAPEISPPIDLEIERSSETFGIEDYEFHPNSETAFEVGWDIQWRLLNVWQRLMDSTGLGHSISANLWSSIQITPDWIREFWESDLKTTYYRLGVSQFTNDKSQILTDESLNKLSSLYVDEEYDGSDLESGAMCSFTQMAAEGCDACGGV